MSDVDFSSELLTRCAFAAPGLADVSSQCMGRILPKGILAILQIANGLVVHDRHFRIFGTVSSEKVPSLEEHNSASWKKQYGDALEGVMIVADDIFGDQYGYRFEGEKKNFLKFHCEGGKTEPLEKGINHLIEGMIQPHSCGLLDIDLILAAKTNGFTPSASQHLAFRVPLMVGGARDIYNLTIESESLHLGTLAQLYQSTASKNDGTLINRFM